MRTSSAKVGVGVSGVSDEDALVFHMQRKKVQRMVMMGLVTVEITGKKSRK